MFLELKNTTIGYKTPLIKGVETSLDLGQVCLLIGNNGVGKTTLIKSLLNQIPVLNGEILLLNKSVKNLTNKKIAEQIAIVFSKAPIPANYTLTDLISLGKYIHYPYYFELEEKDKNDVVGIIENLDLKQYKDFPLSKLSDGNLQKAFIGRALAQNSPMIILDEPTTHLDEKNKLIILKLLRNLAKNHNKLILFSSHDWRLSKEFADQIWMINNQTLEAGITEDVLLKHHELLNPQLFQISENFNAPKIIAPYLEKEMLYSFLQKNHKNNLENYHFELSDQIWYVSNGNTQHKFHSFAEISEFLQNLR